MKNNKWIPISSGLLPKEKEDVQVTYIGYNNGNPYCNKFAYMVDGEWYWANADDEVKVKITAWKYNCEPYMGE